MIPNHEWYHRLFELLSHYRGACYTVAGDPKLWNMDPKTREYADNVLDTARSYKVACWGDSVLWERLTEFRIWTYYKKAAEWYREYYHFGQSGPQRCLEWEVDKMEKEAGVLFLC